MKVPGVARRSRAGAAAAVAVSAMLLAGCGLVGGDGEPGDDAATGSASQRGEATGSPPATLAPQLFDCGTGGDGQLTLADTDLTRATWDMPDGFTQTLRYREEKPVEENILDMWVAEPAEDPVSLNVLNVVSYDGLQWGQDGQECGSVPLSAVGDRLAHYRRVVGAVPLDEAELTEVGGYPAMRQRLELDQYSYEGYWLFSTTQLLHIYCQWTGPDQEETILTGCHDLVESVEVP